MRWDFEQGIEFGRALEHIREHDSQIASLDTRVKKVESKVSLAESWIGRIMTAGGLWVAGTGLNLSAENVGQMIARILR
jgi:hypothetical protein